MDDFMSIAKALGDERRVRVLMVLQGRELCVCQIIDFLGLAPSTVSKHMSILRQARLVKARKQGRWMHYRLPGSEASEAVKSALSWLKQSLADNPVIEEDEIRVVGLIRKHDEKYCQD
ncbi:MAG: winged helix-turn-helix transcriptional regulator [Deltaproteobacteria bacterium]|nr:winged helix-turn-helix transcriptional regulator [Deltaproteobacteria bacterium]